MSSSAGHETQMTLTDIAQGLNEDFQFVADHLPVEVKQGYVGEAFTLGSITGVGVLWASYGGQREREFPHLDPKKDAICDFIVRIGVLADKYGGYLGYQKPFGLTYLTRRDEGPLIDMEVIQPEDLVACPPGPAEELSVAVRALRMQFADMLGVDASESVAA